MNVLFLHQTMIGSMTATGQLLASLTSNLIKEDINCFEICMDIDKSGFSSSQYNLNNFLDNKDTYQQYSLFIPIFNKVQPDIVIYRPDSSINILTNSILELKNKYKFKLILSIMDTWFKSDNIELLGNLFLKSDAIWFISEVMKEYCSKIFNVHKPLYVIANGVDIKYFRFPAISHINPPKILNCRFFGSINEYQTFEGLSLITDALFQHQKKFKLEVFSRQYKTELAQSLLKYSNVSLHAPLPTMREYFKEINMADIIVIPYGWSEECVNYLQYSFGNKIPECLASGKPLIAVGSSKINNMKFLDSLNEEGVISMKDANSSRLYLDQYISNLSCNYADFLYVAQKRKKHIIDTYKIEVIQAKFEKMLFQQCVKNNHMEREVMENIISYLRADKNSMKVEKLITNVYSILPNIKYAIDIGAHHGIHTKGLSNLSSIEFVLALEANLDLKNNGLLKYESAKCEIIWEAIAPSYCLTNGHVNFLINSEYPGRSGIEGLHIWKEIDSTIIFNKFSCKAVTLDKILADKFTNGVDFIKMDVEGAEYAIIFNSSKVWNMRPTIVLENSIHALNIAGIKFNDFYSLCFSNNYSIIDFNGIEVLSEINRTSFNHIWLVPLEKEKILIESICKGFDTLIKES